MLWLFVGLTEVYLLDFFCSGIQFYLLLSPYLCLLYLDLYVLGDEHNIDKLGVVHATRYLFVLIHIWIKGEVGALLNRFKPSSKIFYWPFPRRYFFCGSFMGGVSVLQLLCLCARLFICVLWSSPVGKGLTYWLSNVVSYCVYHFPFGILYQVWYLIVSIPDRCTLTYFGPISAS